MSQRKTPDQIIKAHANEAFRFTMTRTEAKLAMQEFAKQEVEARDELIKELTGALSIICDFPAEDIEHYKENSVTMTLNSTQYSIIHTTLTKAQSFNQE